MAYQPYQSTWNNPYVTQNPYQPVMPTVAQPVQQPVNGVIKVNGRDSAMQYALPPNSTSPALFDNSGKVFYIVTTDGTGMKTVEAFDFSPHVDEQPVTVNGAEFVSRREFDEFAAKVNAVIGASDGVYGPVQAAAKPSPASAGNATAAGADVGR